MADTCVQVAQTNIWLNVITLFQPFIIALAGFITAKTAFQKIQNDLAHMRARQYETIDKVEDVKKEQVEVKKALNGNGGSH